MEHKPQVIYLWFFVVLLLWCPDQKMYRKINCLHFWHIFRPGTRFLRFDMDHFDRINRFLHQFIDLLRKFLLIIMNHIQARFCDRMFCNENGTAVLKRKDVSYASIFSEISTISCLSKPINGRYTGIVQTSFVAASDCIVWLATWPILSPVIRPRHLFSFAKCSANFII